MNSLIEKNEMSTASPSTSTETCSTTDNTSQSLQIFGHRGGFQPDNTLKGFRQALESNLDGIELDVWLTKDEKLIVVHGGNSGEVLHSETENVLYLFDMTYEELLQIDVGEGEKIPQLVEVFSLVNKQLKIYIEIKAPYDNEIKEKYNFKKAVDLVQQLVIEHQYQQFSYISSFDFEILDYLSVLNKQADSENYIKSIYLYNYFDHVELPVPEIYTSLGDGINISSTKLTPEILMNCHEAGKIVGVWINTEIGEENNQLYLQILKLGVDFICTDYPLKLQKVSNEWIERQKLKESRVEKQILQFQSFENLGDLTYDDLKEGLTSYQLTHYKQDICE